MNEARSETKPPGLVPVTAVIADGVSLALANLSILAIPLLLDVYYLAGWRVTLQGATTRIESSLGRFDANSRDRLISILDEVGTWDLLGALSLLVPSFVSGSDRDDLYQPFDRGAISISSYPVAIAAIVLVMLLASVAYAVFGPWLADLAIDRNRNWSQRIRQIPAVSLRVLGLIGLMAGVFLLLVGPLLLVWGLGSLAGLDLQALILPFVTLISIAILALFYFAPEALVVSEVGAPEAMRRSAAVVRQNLSDALLFAGASVVLSIGLAEVGDRMATNLPGLLLAVIGNAFVGCALALASMMFFSQRWNAMAEQSA